ncbi:MAG TPA: hypothetical protein VM680_16365 [Verrucomicrobiae bacterium]|nr:hypothetical protein [Verrucomicrobiae bacterium]
MVKRLLLILLSFTVVCGSGASDLRADAPLHFEVKAIQAAGVENCFQVATDFFSGGSPLGDEGFESLAKLGIKTIITVDGAQPDLERARAHAMRYVHLPHGYDGISRETQLKLIKAMEVVEGPVYIHCHHGKHRGPAAAAVVCMAKMDWLPSEGLQWLATAGTGTNFVGLFATVRDFRKPSREELEKTPADLKDSQRISGLVDSMVAIDETFERLKTLRAAASSKAPDNHLVSEATLLREHFREARRLDDSKKRGDAFLKMLAEAEDLASAFEDSLTSSTDSLRVERAFGVLEKSCVSCHRTHRDEAKSSSPLGR